MIRNKLCKLGLGLVTGLFTFAGIAWADSEPDFKRLVSERAGGIVTVKYILAVSIGGAQGNIEQESESEMTCVMANADGMVMCSNNQLTGFINIIKQLAGSTGQKFSATPKNLEVIAGPKAASYEAQIIARDSELDIVWIQIKNAGDIQFEHIDFSAGKVADVGDAYVVLRRMGNNFGRAIVASEGRIGGITSKPRTLYIPSTAFAFGGGLPVFTASGDVIGLMVTQLPDSGVKSASMSTIFGSGLANAQDALSGLILPAAEVARATARAMEPR